jgi:hypothetical protein
MAGLRFPPAGLRSRIQVDSESSPLSRSGSFLRCVRMPAATTRIGASNAISKSSLATIAAPRTLNTGRGRTLHGIAWPATASCSRLQNGSRHGVQHGKYFWPARSKQMLDSWRFPAQAVDTAPSGGSASAAAPVRPTSCGDGHGTTGADCRQDRRGTRSGIGVAAFSRTARSGAASGAASVRQGPVSAPPDGGADAFRFACCCLVRFRSRKAGFCASRWTASLFRLIPSRQVSMIRAAGRPRAAAA